MLQVRCAELERVAAKGEKAMVERDELKEECEELASSNARMGEKIAELASRNSGVCARVRLCSGAYECVSGAC